MSRPVNSSRFDHPNNVWWVVGIPNRLRESWKVHNLRPALYIQIQKTVILNTCHIVRKCLAEQWIRSALAVRMVVCWEPAKLLWSAG
jgi:hypothetical protein